MSVFSIFFVLLIFHEIIAVPTGEYLQDKDLSQRFQIENFGDAEHVLVQGTESLVSIRDKREISRGRRYGHHNHLKIRSRKNTYKQRKKLHSHTIDHLTRKHRSNKHGSRSN